MQALAKNAAPNGTSTVPGAVRAGEGRAIHEYQYQGKPVPVKPQ